MKDLSITSDGNRLAATLFQPEKLIDKNPAILFIQGWTGKKENSFQYAKALVKLGYICLLVDIQGHGGSQGDINTLTHEQALDDAIAAYDKLSKYPNVDTDNISAVGSSLGGYIAALLTSKRNVKNLLMRAPSNYAKEGFMQFQKDQGIENPGVWEWRKQKRGSHETYSLEAISKFDGHILIIESEKDDVVPHEIIEGYMDAVKDKSKLTHKVLEDAPHSINQGPFRDAVEKIYTDWFSGLIAKS